MLNLDIFLIVIGSNSISLFSYVNLWIYWYSYASFFISFVHLLFAGILTCINAGWWTKSQFVWPPDLQSRPSPLTTSHLSRPTGSTDALLLLHANGAAEALRSRRTSARTLRESPSSRRTWRSSGPNRPGDFSFTTFLYFLAALFFHWILFHVYSYFLNTILILSQIL